MPRVIGRAALVGVLILMGAGLRSGSAQQLAPGAVVRWNEVPLGGRRLEAVVTGATPDSLFLQVAGGSAFRIAPASNPSIEVRGNRNSRGKKALTGAAIGAGIGLVVGIAAKNSCTSDGYFSGCSIVSGGSYVAASTLGGSLWGVLIGALLTPSWQWHPLGANSSVSVRPFVGTHRVGLQLR